MFFITFGYLSTNDNNIVEYLNIYRFRILYFSIPLPYL